MHHVLITNCKNAALSDNVTNVCTIETVYKRNEATYEYSDRSDQRGESTEEGWVINTNQ